ncbi:hypothetical protein BV898_04410 [Hypsibius exemplaris]|uniref:Uncharacterized protein n=1 Tax=Hypsibius exemplaris TaxID=2072580 RepID=A0A1W0X220_HYPEX|nr:hypothetical protein BV898_04410 [Hypsibius exemplaris]
MSDPFYVNRGEIKHNLSRLTASLQKPDAVRDVQADVKLIGELEHQLKDLADTFAIQTSNAKKLGLTLQELSTRKDIVETHQRAFETMREDFSYRVKKDGGEADGDKASPTEVVNGLYSQRQTSSRRFEVERANAGLDAGEEQQRREQRDRERRMEPARESMHEMKQRFEEEDDDDLVEVYQKKATATLKKDAELGLAKGANRRNPGGVTQWMNNHFPLTNRRNRIIFFSFPVVLIVVVVVIILAVTLS